VRATATIRRARNKFYISMISENIDPTLNISNTAASSGSRRWNCTKFDSEL